jgi:hypothetical protein
MNYPIFLLMIMSGFVRMNLFHVLLLMIFVGAALFPVAFSKRVIWVLLYVEFFILAKYVFTLFI